jgi:hypothetical protein
LFHDPEAGLAYSATRECCTILAMSRPTWTGLRAQLPGDPEDEEDDEQDEDKHSEEDDEKEDMDEGEVDRYYLT